jgi:uncharacterized membrane protein
MPAAESPRRRIAMTMTVIYLAARALHVLLGAFWLGSVVFVVYFLMPSMAEAGPDAAKVMAGLIKRRYLAVVPVVALLTILLGLWLYWRFTGGFDPAQLGTPGAMVFGTGGILAIAAIHVGLLGMRRNTLRALARSRDAAALPDGAEKAAAMQAIRALRQRALVAGQIVAVLLVITALLMAIGHYV